jgi:large subunit ribosomal protein L29
MKAEDLKTKTQDELMKLLLDTKKEQFNQRFQRANGTLEKTHDIRSIRKTVARIKTFMNMKTDAVAAPKAKPAAKKKSTKSSTKAA